MNVVGFNFFGPMLDAGGNLLLLPLRVGGALATELMALPLRDLGRKIPLA